MKICKYGGKKSQKPITPSYFPAPMNMANFHYTETRDRTDYKLAFYPGVFIMNILRFSNNLMQKPTSITPSIYKTIHQRLIFKTRKC